MIKKVSINFINNLLSLKSNFILCTYYVDSYSNFYAAMLNKNLKKDVIDLYYVEVDEFKRYFNLENQVFPIFYIFIKGKKIKQFSGFIKYNDLFNEFTQNIVLCL